MSAPFLGELRIMAFNFAPQGWALCNGQILPINQNIALFSLIGTFFGGNGVNLFQLPDLRGRVPVASGNYFTPGVAVGESAHTLTSAEVPTHGHNMQGTSSTGNTATPGPTTAVAAGQTHDGNSNVVVVDIYGTAPADRTFAQNALAPVGNNQPHENRQPYLALNICIALQGIFPSQN